MQRHRLLVFTCFLAGCVGGVSGALGAASFYELGVVAGQGQSYAEAVSRDGNTVVGRSGDYAFRWTRDGGLVTLRPVGSQGRDAAYDVSADGSVVVGDWWAAYNGAFRWTEAGGFQNVAPGRPYGTTLGRGVSPDGSVVVGSTLGQRERNMFGWTESGGTVILGGRQANDISEDGSVVVGEGSGSSPRAMRWTHAMGAQALPSLPFGGRSNAWAITPDGETIVGVAWAGVYNHAVRWTDGGVERLDPDGSFVHSTAFDVSDDGRTIVGSGGHAVTRRLEAFIYDPTRGMRRVTEVLEEAGVDLGDWQLLYANGVSGDGTVLAGWGYHGGREEAWVAVIPEPSFGAMTVGVAVIAAGRRRRRSVRRWG